MGFATGAKGLVIERRPRRGLPAEIGPQMHDGAQRLITVAAQSDDVNLAALIASAYPVVSASHHVLWSPFGGQLQNVLCASNKFVRCGCAASSKAQ